MRLTPTMTFRGVERSEALESEIHARLARLADRQAVERVLEHAALLKVPLSP